MWKPTPNRNANGGVKHYHPQQQQPQGQKMFSLDNDFNGDVDGRNFDEVYGGHAKQAQAAYPSATTYSSYPPFAPYGANARAPGLAGATMYHQQNYPNAYTSGGAYPRGASYYPNAQSQGYGASYGYGGAHDQQYQQYPNQYAGNYMQTQIMGQAGYDQYGGYYAADGSYNNGSAESGNDPYAYNAGDGECNQETNSDQCE